MSEIELFDPDEHSSPEMSGEEKEILYVKEYPKRDIFYGGRLIEFSIDVSTDSALCNINLCIKLSDEKTLGQFYSEIESIDFILGSRVNEPFLRIPGHYLKIYNKLFGRLKEAAEHSDTPVRIINFDLGLNRFVKELRMPKNKLHVRIREVDTNCIDDIDMTLYYKILEEEEEEEKTKQTETEIETIEMRRETIFNASEVTHINIFDDIRKISHGILYIEPYSEKDKTDPQPKIKKIMMEINCTKYELAVKKSEIYEGLFFIDYATSLGEIYWRNYGIPERVEIIVYFDIYGSKIYKMFDVSLFNISKEKIEI